MRCIRLLLFLFLFSSLRVFAQYQLDLVAQLPYPDSVELSSLWGYTDDAGNEYALVGNKYGTSIVDLSVATDPHELFFVPGAESTWREIKTYGHYAYVTTEGYGAIQILDLTNLPASIDTSSFTGDATHPIHRAHTLWIDENGFIYFFGPDILTGISEGAYIANLNPDPLHPVYAGSINDVYIHDGFVRHDTLWAAEIYAGLLAVYDMSDKASPELIGAQITSAHATHNCWPSDDGKYVFTTDEIYNGFVSAFDVTDITDIQLLDQIKHGPPDSTIAHNVHYKNGFLITAHYSEGVVIYDVHEPDNMIETGHYDTSPFGPGTPLTGVWGVYPYFSSGLIIASDMQEGLFVLQPDYERAAYLEGNVTTNLGTDLFNAKIKILATDVTDSTDVFGAYKTGYYLPGTYTVQISANGCSTETFNDILLSAGEIQELNATLICDEAIDDVDDATNEMFVQYLPEAQSVFIHWNTTPDQPVSYLLYDAKGSMAASATQMGDATISVAGFSPGMYLLKASGEGISAVRKVVIR